MKQVDTISSSLAYFTLQNMLQSLRSFLPTPCDIPMRKQNREIPWFNFNKGRALESKTVFGFELGHFLLCNLCETFWSTSSIKAGNGQNVQEQERSNVK